MIFLPSLSRLNESSVRNVKISYFLRKRQSFDAWMRWKKHILMRQINSSSNGEHQDKDKSILLLTKNEVFSHLLVFEMCSESVN